jgi:hypothetical protein
MGVWMDESPGLTLALRVLPPRADLPDAVDERGVTPLPVPTPTAGDIDLTGIFGGGPGSAPGDRLCIEREGPPGAFIMTVQSRHEEDGGGMMRVLSSQDQSVRSFFPRLLLAFAPCPLPLPSRCPTCVNEIASRVEMQWDRP